MSRPDHKKFLEDKKQMGTKPQNVIHERGDLHRSGISCKPQITQRPEQWKPGECVEFGPPLYESPTCT